ncbi:MAG: hypothetical protein ACTHN5_02045 [Phycisphaerae bacterium]
MGRTGRLYVCGWKKVGVRDYQGWVMKRRSIFVEGTDFEDLGELLTEEIAEAYGDPEPQLEFEPPIPGTSGVREMLREGLMELHFASHFHLEALEGLFSGGLCKRCRQPIGGRTEDVIRVTSMWPRDTLYSSDDRFGASHLLIASERFFAVLGRKDRAAMSLREVVREKGTRKRYFEILPKRFVPLVSARGLPVGGWECGVCGYHLLSHKEPFGGYTDVVCREDLGKEIPGVFFVGDAGSYSMCLRKDRWEALKGELRKMGVSASPLAVTDKGKCVRRPRLKRHPRL